ncbi:MAG: Holliday junction branch migration protein RuvA [Muribaculaceae bacterium]|nr:Holliday junction branch migration protein RuvA [Muribaculaceae bacterium]
MVEYIRGTVAELTPTYVVIEAGGVGYGINITLPCFTSLEGKSEARLLIHEVIREDAWVYYGFAEESERVLFRLLIGVSGVGANTARMILSSLPVADLEQTIMSGDVRRLKGVKGIGAKTAERIIVDLKDKIKPSDSTLLIQSASTSEDFDEALAAMVMLGFPRQAAHKVLTKLYAAEPGLKVEAAIKKALTLM